MTAEAGNDNTAEPEAGQEIQGAEESVDTTASAEESTEEVVQTEVEQDGSKTPDEPPAWFTKKMAKVTKQKYQQEARIQELENKLRQATTEKQPTLTRDDFGEDTEGWTEHLVDQKAQELFTKQQQQQMAQQQQYEAAVKASQAWENKIAAVRENLPDYQEVVSSADVDLPPDLVQDIMDSDLGPQIAYHLAKNPEDAEKAVAMNERSRTRYLARLEVKLENQPAHSATPQTPKVSQAPAPVSTPKGQGSNSAKSLEDWVKSRNEEDRKRGLL